MPSTTSSSLSRLLASSTVMTPSLPTFCMALAIMSPMAFSPLAEMVPTWAISAEPLTFLERFLIVLDDVGHGLVDAALQIHRVHAGGDRLQPLAHDGLGEQGGGGGAVAGGVVGLRGDLAQHLRAHVLELILELDLLRHGHAVLGRARRAERLLEDHVAALRSERDLDRVGENVDAAQHALAGIGCEFYVFGCHFNLLLVDGLLILRSAPSRVSKDEPICFARVLRDGRESGLLRTRKNSARRGFP